MSFKQLAAACYENVAALGEAVALLGLDKSVVGDAVDAFFGNKDASVSAANRAAVDAAHAWAGTSSARSLGLNPAAAGGASRLVVNGNEALALGALAGGVKLCAFYPMSPATSLPRT